MGLRIPESAVASVREALGPFRTYLLTRGLALNFNSEGALVSDGVGSSISFPAHSELNEFGFFSPETYARLLDEVQRQLSVRLVGLQGDSLHDAAFTVDGHIIPGGWLNEALLSRLHILESLVRRRVILATGIDEGQLMEGLNVGAALGDDVSYGKVGPAGFQQVIDAYTAIGFPMEQTFFVLNATGIAEDMRNTLATVCSRRHAMDAGLMMINQTRPAGAPEAASESEPWEMRVASGRVAGVSNAFKESVAACSTALDLLYQLFVYLTREPFLNPEFPAKLYFPDAPGRGIFQSGGASLPNDAPAKDLPYAIANLVPAHFRAFRSIRNALEHNMAHDELLPRVYQGWKQLPVNNQPLHYAQYLTIDIDAQGALVTHPWVRRFYETQTDAQDSLFEWLELTWQCVFDTTEWLIKRWSNHVPST